MHTLELTDNELAVIKHAIETHNDMQIDMAFESIQTVDLFPRGDSVTTISSTQANALRKELRQMISNLTAIRGVMAKVGSQTHDNGFSK